ncbi:uncharacterized protein si:ch211-248a14.8 [Cololabis saira]|uniref:uncharacterized protein si:ch211-248a14.8 n=1 Tax=Cololabis saira TaxID=129043 RepID=UPI002AD29DCB|nr:uncharacterized protein si:ch211-248a14.8 [Cololabis saira]
MTPCLLGKSSGRCKGGWCASAVKSLSSIYALKPLIPTFCIGIVVIYDLADRLRNFVAGIFIPQYHYPYAVALCFAQVLVSLLFLNVLHVLGVVPLRHYSRCLGERLLLPSVCNSVQGVLVMWARARSTTTGLFLYTVPLLPLVTVCFSFALKLAPPPSKYSSYLISFLSGMFIIITVSKDLPSIEPLEYLYAPLALILHSLSLVVMATVSEAERHHPPDAQASVFDIYHVQLVNQSWVLGLLWVLHPESPWHVLRRSSWRTLLFHGYLLALLLLGMLLNFLIGISALCISPLAGALLYSARQMIQPFYQLL